MKNQQQKKEVSYFADSHMSELSNDPKHLNKNILCPFIVCRFVYYHSNSHSARHRKGLFWKQCDIIR